MKYLDLNAEDFFKYLSSHTDCFEEKISNYITNGLEPQILRNILYRADWVGSGGQYRIGRTYDEFIQQISDRTTAEQNNLIKVQKDLKLRGSKLSFINHGVNNRGRFITKSKNFDNADFIISIDNIIINRTVDVKVSPVTHKATFKVRDLNKHIKQEDLILLILGEKWWCLFGAETMGSLLTLQKIKFAPFGYKIVVNIGPGRIGNPIPFERLFCLYEFGSTDKFLGATNKYINFDGA